MRFNDYDHHAFYMRPILIEYAIDVLSACFLYVSFVMEDENCNKRMNE